MKIKILNPNQIITLNDSPIRNEQILKLYFRMFHKGKRSIVPPCPVIHKDLLVNNFNNKLKNLFRIFEIKNPKAQYFLLDGSHKTTAATLSHKRIPVMIFKSDRDIQNAKRLVEEGEIISLTTGATMKEAINALKRHFNKTKSFQTVEEKTNKMIIKKKLPAYMVKAYRNQTQEEIIRRRPFGNILKLASIESLKSEYSRSGESFRVKSINGKTYKLRYFNDPRRAKEVEKNIKRLSGFPKCYGREGRYLLLDWIDKRLKRINLDILYQIGKMIGAAHKLNIKNKEIKLDDIYHENVKEIKKHNILGKETINKINNIFETSKKKSRIDILLEYRDTHIDNFAIDKRGKVYFIDEDGIDYRVKGSGFRKVLRELVNSKKQEGAFWKGYNEKYNNNYFDANYKHFVYLLEVLKDIGSKYKNGELGIVDKRIKELKMLINKIEKTNKMVNYDFWDQWKSVTEIEKEAIIAVIRARQLVLESIPKDELVAIYIKGSFARREMKEGSDVDMVPIVTENKYEGKVFRINSPEIDPVIVVPLSLWELEHNELFSKSDSLPDLRAKPDCFLRRLNECRLVYGRPLDPREFFVRSDAEALKEQIRRVRDLWIPAYELGKVDFSIKEVFWLVELEQNVRGIPVEHSYEGIMKSIKDRSHIIYDAFKFRTGEYKSDAEKKVFIIKLKKYLSNIKKLI